MAQLERAAYAINAPTAIAAARKLLGYVVQTPGTSGCLVFNDCSTLTEASAANQVVSIPSSSIPNPGEHETLNWPLAAGLCVSEVPTGATIAVAYSIDVE